MKSVVCIYEGIDDALNYPHAKDPSELIPRVDNAMSMIYQELSNASSVFAAAVPNHGLLVDCVAKLKKSGNSIVEERATKYETDGSKLIQEVNNHLKSFPKVESTGTPDLQQFVDAVSKAKNFLQLAESVGQLVAAIDADAEAFLLEKGAICNCWNDS